METSRPTLESAAAWSAAEFGAAALGDRRRTARLCHVAAAVWRHPAGRVTQVFAGDAAGQQGAYDWLENAAVGVRAVARAHHDATARRAAAHAFVTVSVDGSDVTVTDPARVKDTGPTADRAHPSRGFGVVSALATSPDGATLGLLGQVFWARVDGGVRRDRHQRALCDKESWHVHRAIAQAEAALARTGVATRPWFQIDRAGDATDVLLAAVRTARLLTVRACYDRRVCSVAAPRLVALGATHPVLGTYDVAVPARDGAPARIARVAVRADGVTLPLHERLARRTWATTVSTVWVRELDPPPGVAPLDWTLHTTYPVADFGDACLVLWAYTQRWRVEDFHRAWKSGGCRVEDLQLRSAGAVWKWSTILAAVATRLLALRDAARTDPSAPASTQFSAAELEALVVLRQPRDHVAGQMPTVGRAVRWIAELGGYTGIASGGPPGVTVIGRGLDRVQIVVTALANLKKPRSDQ